MGNFKYYTHPDTGEKHIRVSSVLAQLDKPALVQWAANCATDYIWQQWKQDREQMTHIENWLKLHTDRAKHNFRSVSRTALNIGTAVHGAIEEYLKVGIRRELDSEQARAGFDAFFDWMEDFGVTRDDTLCTERTVYGFTLIPRGGEYTTDDRWESLHYAGTYDWLLEKDGEVWLIDFKTSKGFYEEMAYQLAAYRQAESAYKIDHAAILRLDKNTGKPHFKEYTDYKHDLWVFNVLLELWHLRHETGGGDE